MPRSCSVCIHIERDAVDRGLVAGDPFRLIAERFDLSIAALSRHKADHLPATLVKAREAQEVARADDLLQQVRDLQARTLGLLDKAEAAGKLGTAVMAIREMRGNLELLAKLLGELDDRPNVVLWVSPEWRMVRGVLLTVLMEYPEARVAVAEQLATLETG